MTKLKFVLCGLSAFLLSSVSAEEASMPTVTVDEDTITITTTASGELATYLKTENNDLATKISGTKFAGYVLKGNYSSADLRALFALKTGDTPAYEAVTKLVMRDATVDEIAFKGMSEKTEDGKKIGHFKISFLDDTSNDQAPYDKKFEALTWWEMPKIKSTSTANTYKLPTCQQNVNFATAMPKLEYVLINDGCTEVSQHAFTGLSTLKKVAALGTGLKKLGWSCFGFCTQLADISGLLNAGVEEMDYGVFYGAGFINTGGRADFLPSTLKKIGSAAFSNVHGKVGNEVKNVLGPVLVIPASVTEIGSAAFAYSGIEDVYFLGDTLPTCGNMAFTYSADPKIVKNDDNTDNYATRDKFTDTDMLLTAVSYQKTAAMLHYRPDLKAEEIAKITDNTRKYTVKDKFLGDKRLWPTWKEYRKVTENATGLDENGKVNSKLGKNFEGTALTDEQQKYQGYLNFAFSRADAPLPTATVPTPTTEWSTLCLPIDLKIDEDTELYTLEKVTRNPSTHRVTLFFTKDAKAEGVAKAWTPYLIRTTNPTEATAESENDLIINHPLVRGSEKAIEVMATTEGSETEQGTWTYYFLGNCEGLYHKSGEESTGVSIDRPRYSYYLGQLNDEVSFFYQQTSKQRVWKPYTCAVMASNDNEIYTDKGPGITCDDSFRDATGKLLAKDFNSILGPGESTAIEHVEIVTPDIAADGNVYSLDGRLVKAGAHTTAGLPKGIYVCNGKKIIVK